MISTTDLRSGVIFELDGTPYQVISYKHTKMARGNATITVKVRNLKTGAVTQKKFSSGMKVEESSVSRRDVQFLYTDKNNLHFMDNSTFEQFALPQKKLKDTKAFLKEGMNLKLLMHNAEPFSVELPNSVEYLVKEAGATEKGNSVTNVFKEVKLENNLKVKTPLFIKVGDKIKVDTRTGEYVERVRED